MKRCIMALACWLSPTVAFADWQFTHWGMQKSEVLQAIGDLRNSTFVPKLITTLSSGSVSGYYTSSGIEFIASLQFDETGGLSKVTLRPNDPEKCFDLKPALLKIYGKDAIDFGRFQSGWRDEANGNLVILTSISPDTCALEYEKLAAPGTPGSL